MAAPTSHIAIVDDDAGVRRALRRLLAASSLETAVYESGEDLLVSLEAHPPACIVLDLKMPGMSGLDVLRRLAGRAAHVPVIIMTAHDAPGAERRCRQAGAVAYLRKPVDQSVLLAAIAHATDAAAKP